MTMWIRPRVRMYSGIDRICTIGLMNALTRPKITATAKMMPTLCNLVSPPTKLSPWTTRVTTQSANPVNAARMRNGPMGLNLLRGSQQIGVHNPTVTCTGVGPQRGDALPDLADRAGDEQLVVGAGGGAPPGTGLGG